MKIYSMTATFGKLENQTLTLQPGLNVISAPNEWGKSTWCAFLVSDGPRAAPLWENSGPMKRKAASLSRN